MISGALLLVTFAGCTANLARRGAEPNPEIDAMVYQDSAKSLCQEVVKRQLKAPTTALFADEAATGYKALTVTGTVSSQNSFGAMIANPYSCSGTVDASETVNIQLESFG